MPSNRDNPKVSATFQRLDLGQGFRPPWHASILTRQPFPFHPHYRKDIVSIHDTTSKIDTSFLILQRPFCPTRIIDLAILET